MSPPEVTIELKGKEIIKQELKTQWNEEEQLVAYQIPDAEQDDKITVTAYWDSDSHSVELKTILAQ